MALQAYIKLAGKSDEDTDDKINYFKAQDLLLRYQDDTERKDLLNQAYGILKKTHENTPYLKFAYAKIMKERGETDLAIAEFRQSAKESPGWTYPLVELADSYLNQKVNYDSSQYFIHKALRIPSQDPYPLAQIADFYKAQGRYDSALYYYKKSIAIDSLIDQPFITLGDFYWNTMSDRPAAIRSYMKAYAINNKNGKLASTLGGYYSSSGT